jgi:iron complex outermembrane recepter protein
MKKLFSLTAGVCIALTSLAQSSSKVTGNIKDGGNQKIIDAATISLLKAKDSSLVKATYSDKDGSFSFENVKDGKYLVLATSVGHTKVYSKPIEVTGGAAVTVGMLQLLPEDKSMKTVTVVSKKPFIEHRLDKTIVNVDAGISNAGSTALDVLEKSPGVSVDKDGNISLKGKQGVKVFIDGKISFLSGAELASLLRNMQATQMDQLEIMTNPSAKYDASGNAGVINIKLKKTKTAGFNGSITAGFGIGQGGFPKTTEGVNFNYRKNKLNLFGSLNHNYRENYQTININRKFRDKNTKELLGIFDQQAIINRVSQSRSARVGIDYSISKKTTIGALVSGFADPEDFSNTNNTFLKDKNGVTESRTYATNDTKNFWKNISGNINFRHVFDSTGRELTADADYSHYSSSSKQALGNYYFDADNIKTGPSDTLLGNIPSTITIYSAKADYSQNLKGNAKFEAGIKFSSVKTDNNARYDSLINNIPVADMGRTNHFVYDEQIQAAYVNVSKSLSKKWDAQMGLRLENTTSNGKQLTTGQRFTRNYTQLFPTAYVSYKMNEKNTFSLNYGRRIERPDYADLNPFYFFLDKYTYQTGNPELRPQFSHNIELSHSFKGFLNTTLNYYKATDLINDVFEQNEATRETFVIKSNIASQQQIGLAVSAGFAVGKKINVNLYSNLSNNRFKGFINNSNVDISNSYIESNASLQLDMGKGWKSELSGFYRTKALEGVMVINALGSLNAGISKAVLKNKGTIKLGFRDILWTQKGTGTAQYAYIDTKFSQQRDSRQVALNFNWRFGKGKAQAPKRKIGGADEEKGRVKSGGN